MNRNWLIVIGGALVLLVASIAQFLFPRTTISPSPTVLSEISPIESNGATSTSTNTNPVQTVNTPEKVSPQSFSIEKSDSIISWDFKGVYADRSDLIAKAEAEIQRLSNLMGKGTYTNTTLYVSIANQYDLLGDGKQEYEYLGRAIEEGGTTSGLPWHNLGVLMERLGALQTARIAYEKATLIQPKLRQWHYAYLSFLTTRMKDNTADIEKEYLTALENLGQDAEILSIYSAWKQL